MDIHVVFFSILSYRCHLHVTGLPGLKTGVRLTDSCLPIRHGSKLHSLLWDTQQVAFVLLTLHVTFPCPCGLLVIPDSQPLIPALTPRAPPCSAIPLRVLLTQLPYWQYSYFSHSSVPGFVQFLTWEHPNQISHLLNKTGS